MTDTAPTSIQTLAMELILEQEQGDTYATDLEAAADTVAYFEGLGVEAKDMNDEEGHRQILLAYDVLKYTSQNR